MRCLRFDNPDLRKSAAPDKIIYIRNVGTKHIQG